MSPPAVLMYGGAFGLGLALSLLLTPLARRVALRREILDRPGGYKAQKAPVPYLGGVAIVVAFCVVVTLAAVIGPPQGGIGELVTILAVGLALSLLGLFDDVRGGLSPWVRLAFQTAAGIAMVAAGVSVALFPYEVVNGAVTVLWIVGITNAFNLLDNMDGLSAGVAAIAAGFFSIIAVLNGQVLVAPLAAALAGCALGFLRSNFHPARIYMGDAGSLFIGFMLAVVGTKLSFPIAGRATFLVPILVLGVAVFDTTLVTVTRLLHGLNPFNGGRDHTSHRLVFLGLPVRRAVGLIYAATLACGSVALVMAQVSRTLGLAVMAAIVSLGAVAGLLLGRVRVYEETPQALADGSLPARPHGGEAWAHEPPR